MVWWMCQFIVIVYIHGNSTHADDHNTATADVTGVREPLSSPCGDDTCVCDRFKADCSGHRGNLTYVPKLPDNITSVDLSHNSFASKALTSDVFGNLTRVTSLDLSYNTISWLPRSVFKGMKHLTSLYLGGNKALEPASLREALSIPTLLRLSVQSCNLSPPAAGLFKNSTSYIQGMNLDHNPHGRTYNLEGFCPLRSLHHLSLSHCDFREITSSCQLQTLSNLDLSGNTLRRFPKTCIGKGTSMFPALMSLGVQRNRIEVLSTADICLPSLTRLDMSYNFIKVYPAGTFSSLKFPVLEKLHLHHQASYWHIFMIGTKIEDRAFDNPRLLELQLSHNELEVADAAAIGKRAFANCRNLQDLQLDSNNFTYVKDPRFSQLFGHMKFLKRLSISNSKFELLSKKTFARFPALTTLFLYDNIISAIPDGAFDSLRRLDRLFLHNNKIKTINEGTFSAETRHRLSSLTLGFNPFICSCELVWFRQWFSTDDSKFYRHSYIGINDYRCHNIPDVALGNFSMTEQACLVSREVNLFIIQGSSVTITILTLVSLVFRYRWYLRLLMYEVFRGRDGVRKQRLLVNDFEHDVFVSYASEDLPWVREQLVVQLEDELGLRLCIHERDFVPGKNIVDNIVQCVDGSKKILMVFSQHFVRSQWCQFELALCLSHVMDNDDALIIVCVDDVTSRQMSSAMMAVLKTTTYIQWREEEDAVASFWGRLSLGLNEIIPHGDHYV
ncbi:hypothetical protein ACOMHN_012894 [Nucella lapillus]